MCEIEQRKDATIVKGFEIGQDKNQILLKKFFRFNSLRKNIEERPSTMFNINQKMQDEKMLVQS